MFDIMMMFSWLVVLSGLFSFLFNYTHFLSSLLSLECIAVGIYGLMGGVFFELGSEGFYLLYTLVMMVCEGVLGLVLLVVVCYSHGCDMTCNMSSVSC